MSSEPIEGDISLNRRLNRIVVGDTALALYHPEEGELKMGDRGETWVKFGSGDVEVSVDFQKLAVQEES